MKFNKHTIYIGLFAILYLIVAFSSFFHACAFFGLANNSWMSVILAFAFEVGQAAVLFSLLTSKKDRGRIMPWVLMSMFTLVQVIGNVYSSYKYIITNSVENLRYFKEPIFVWTDLPNDQANVIIVYLVGALLPIAALLLTSMITNYLTDIDEEKNEESPKEITFNNPIGTEGDSLLNQHSMLQMENQGLHESIDNKEKELERLKEELKSKQDLIDLQNQKINDLDQENQELVKEKFDKEPKDDKEEEDSQQGLSGTDVGLTTTEEGRKDDRDEDTKTFEDDKPAFQTFSELEYTPTVKQLNEEVIKEPEKIINETDEPKQDQFGDEGQESLETEDKQLEETVAENSHSNNEEPIKEKDTKSNELVGDPGDPGITDENLKVADALMGGNILSRSKKYSHFINNNSKRS